MILFAYLCSKICLLLNTPAAVDTTLRCRRNSCRFEAGVPEKNSSFFISPLFVFVLYCPFVCLRSLLSLRLSSFFIVPLFVFVFYCPFVCLRSLLSLSIFSNVDSVRSFFFFCFINVVFPIQIILCFVLFLFILIFYFYCFDRKLTN